MACKDIAEARSTLIGGSCSAQLPLWMTGRMADAQLPDLLVADCGETPAPDQRLVATTPCSQKAQRSVTHAAYDSAGVSGLKEKPAEIFTLFKIVGGAPPSGKEDSVVTGAVNRADRKGGANLASEGLVFEISTIRGGPHRPAQRHRLDGYDAAPDARDIHLHAGIQKCIVGRRHLGGENAGFRASGSQTIMAGRYDKSAPVREAAPGGLKMAMQAKSPQNRRNADTHQRDDQAEGEQKRKGGENNRGQDRLPKLTVFMP